MYQSCYSLPSVSFIGGTSFRFIFEMDKLPENIPRDKGRLIFNFALSDYQIRDFSTPRIEYAHSALNPSSHFMFEETADGALRSVVVTIDPERTVYLRGKYLYQLTVLSDDGECYIDGHGSAEITKNLNPDFIGDDEHTVPNEETRISAIIALAESYPLLAESYARGGTGTRSGEDSDNVKYYAESAAAIVDAISDDAERAENAAASAEDSKTSAALSAINAGNSVTEAAQIAAEAAGSKNAAATSATNAAASASSSAESATLAESYAHGGTNTRPGEDADNALYYKERASDSAAAAAQSESAAESAKVSATNSASDAADSASDAEQSAQTATSKSEDASASALLAESYAHGGTGSRTGENTDNAKYWSERAAEIAGGDFATHTELNAITATIGYVYMSASQPANMTVYDVWYKEVE